MLDLFSGWLDNQETRHREHWDNGVSRRHAHRSAIFRITRGASYARRGAPIPIFRRATTHHRSVAHMAKALPEHAPHL
jgi:hypothetical protein